MFGSISYVGLIGTVALGLATWNLWTQRPPAAYVGQGACVTPFEEPVNRTDQALLRHLVLEHKSSERRRRFPAVLHLGSAGGPVVGRVDESAASLDDALRSELLSALWRRARQRLSAPHKAMAWLTRPGTLEVQDVDLAWLRAVGALDDGEGRSLPFVVITRTGWRDPRSGATRTWVRCRRQR